LTYKLAYRADVDGLRAIAVLAVIASHLPEKLLPSGFLGVDVFFAISGFVVTASLMSQRRTRLLQLYAGFLSRRVKRLLPALTLCVAVTCAVVLATDPFPRHSIQTGLAALFGFANILLFFFELDYFSPSSLFNAFTHTWSLGVEEQFYVVFPMFAWLFYFRQHATSFKALALAMILGSGVSVTLFALLYPEHQAAAFFLMPTRIWEL
jgi:peptidoglycan/LPS O-acetylase OafA/YrhL